MSSDLWLPPGSRRFEPEIEKTIAESKDPAQARRNFEEMQKQGVSLVAADSFGADVAEMGTDAAMLVFPTGWGRVRKPNGESVACAFVENEHLERMILDGTAETELAGIIDRADHPLINELCPAIHFRFRAFQTFTPLEFHQEPCPYDWRTEVQEAGIALAIWKDEKHSLYVAMPPAVPTPGLVLTPRDGKIGRNDPCPCGSGMKLKRCCGR